MILALDIQHYGLPGAGLNKRGATADIDGDGRQEIWESEAELTPFYVHAAGNYATQEGGTQVLIEPIEPSSYARRAERFKRTARNTDLDMVVALCHLNAADGTHDYGLVLYEHTRPQDKIVADAIRDQLGDLPELEKALTRVAAPTGDWTRAYACLKHYADAPSNLHAVLVEPWFIDNKKHQSLAGGDGPWRVGRAIARGALTVYGPSPLLLP